MGQHICLITTTSIAHDPRLLKEADSLYAAGYDVRVVSCQNLGWVAKYDDELMKRRAWHLEAASIVRHRHASWRLFWITRARSHFFKRVLGRISLAGGIAERAHVRAYSELLALALREPVDLYIAHALRALPIAAQAASQQSARLGFDAEDYHTGELGANQHDSIDQCMIEYIEEKYIRRCDYVSVPSEPIAEALAQRYNISRPLVIHNVFPWQDRATLDGHTKDRRGAALSLYWFSQTIGSNRGIQDAVRAAGLLDVPVQIHLRGSLAASVRAELTDLARACGVVDQLYFHPQVSPNELLARTAEHDIGLALEPGLVHSLNNALTTSNKLFAYMLAGLAVAATDVIGQRALLQSCPNIGFLYRSGDHQSLAAQLRIWAADSAALCATQRASLEAARNRWNWEIEQGKLLNQVGQVLERSYAASSDRRR